MSSEARITSGINILKTNLQYNSFPTAFVADVTGSKGPTPGSVTATTAGVQIDLSELTVPGLCRVMNQGDTNTVMLGIYDATNDVFLPMLDLLPGETYAVRLSQLLGEGLNNEAGTDTKGSSNNQLMAKAIGGSTNILVEAFEK